MRSVISFCAAAAVFTLLPATASAQEMSVEEMIESIQRTVGTDATQGDRDADESRAFDLRTGSDSGAATPAPVAPARTSKPPVRKRPRAAVAPPPLPVPEKVLKCQVALKFYMILFERGSATISDDEQTTKTISNLTEALKSGTISTIPFIVRGHTDSTGSYQVNRPLSQARAEAVAQRLIVGGIAPDRVGAYGLADTMPADAADPESFKNRRVDICIAPQ